MSDAPIDKRLFLGWRVKWEQRSGLVWIARQTRVVDRKSAQALVYMFKPPSPFMVQKVKLFKVYRVKSLGGKQRSKDSGREQKKLFPYKDIRKASKK